MLPATLICLAAAGAPPAPPGALPSVRPWGEDGHRIVGAAAAAALPAAVPAFFRDASRQLAYLGFEPDRWRGRDQGALDEAFTPDHFVNLERLPDGALDEPGRWSFVRRLYVYTRMRNPEREAGLLPYRTLELYQRLLGGWRLWRVASPEERPWIEQRIVNDAGLLGHYVADGAQPLHTTIHYDGWAAGAANPNGFPAARGLHARFESAYVRAHVAGMRVPVRAEPQALADVPSAIRAHLLEAHGLVAELYRIDRDVGFDPDRAAAPEALAFTVARLEAGSRMLRDLWWTAWVESGAPGPR